MQKINTFELTGIHTAKKINFLIKKKGKTWNTKTTTPQDDRQAKTQRDNEEKYHT